MHYTQENWTVAITVIRSDGYRAEYNDVHSGTDALTAMAFADELAHRADDMLRTDDWQPGHSQAKDF